MCDLETSERRPAPLFSCCVTDKKENLGTILLGRFGATSVNFGLSTTGLHVARRCWFFFFLWATFGLETSGPNYPVTQHSVLPQRPLYECFLFLPKNKIDKAESIRNAVGFLRTLRGDHNGSLTSERSVVSLLWSSLRGENRYWLISVLNFVGYCARLRYLVFIRRGCFV